MVYRRELTFISWDHSEKAVTIYFYDIFFAVFFLQFNRSPFKTLTQNYIYAQKYLQNYKIKYNNTEYTDSVFKEGNKIQYLAFLRNKTFLGLVTEDHTALVTDTGTKQIASAITHSGSA